MCTVGKNEKLTQGWKFREINPSLVKTLLSRDFCQNCVRVNFCIFHTVFQRHFFREIILIFYIYFSSKLYFFSFFTEIHVRQYPGARLVNHQFTIEFSFTKAKNPKGWEWMFLNKIPRLYGDFNSESILVRKIGESPFLFTWTNDSLTQQNCPKTEIRGLFSELIEGQDAAYKTSYGSASSDLKVSYYQCGFF